jgi:hypothetical protein
MKKLLCIALFSIAIMANANNNKKDIVVNNSTEIVTNASNENEISINDVLEFENGDFNEETFEDYSDCGDQGDLYYSNLMATGNYTHRQARSLRRDNVRECRGGTWAWLGVCVGFIGHCD